LLTLGYSKKSYVIGINIFGSKKINIKFHINLIDRIIRFFIL
jgi:hypothetical protein